MLRVTGIRTTIVQELRRILSEQGHTHAIHKLGYNPTIFTYQKIEPSKGVDRFVLAAGVLYPKSISSQTDPEIQESLRINLICVIQLCEEILENIPRARIVVIGSESGIKGSFDTTYAASKAAIHNYVNTRKLSYPEQQIVCIAPSIIEDSGMTQERDDLDNVKLNALSTPKQRLLMAREVAELIYYLLYVDRGYITNTVIPIDGGKRA